MKSQFTKKSGAQQCSSLSKPNNTEVAAAPPALNHQALASQHQITLRQQPLKAELLSIASHAPSQCMPPLAPTPSSPSTINSSAAASIGPAKPAWRRLKRYGARGITSASNMNVKDLNEYQIPKPRNYSGSVALSWDRREDHYHN